MVSEKIASLEDAELWRVVGGEAKGGIVVRLDEEIESELCPKRLALGSVVRQWDLLASNGRLHYELVSGDGPTTGWVSTQLQQKGGGTKDLLVKLDKTAKQLMVQELLSASTEPIAESSKAEERQLVVARMQPTPGALREILLRSRELTPLRPRPAAEAARTELHSRYKQEGFVAPLYALGPEEVSEALAGFLRYETLHVDRVEKRTRYVRNEVWLPWLRDVAKHPTIVNAVAEAFGTEGSIYLYNTQMLARLPGKSLSTSMGLDWHTDTDRDRSRFRPMDRWHFLTAFVALSACDRLHGCLRARPTPSEGERSTEKEVDLELQPGEFSLHGPSTPHTGGLNDSDETRYCIAFRYVSGEACDTYTDRLRRDTALLVSSGRDDDRRQERDRDQDQDLFDAMAELDGEATEDGRLLREELIHQRTMGLPCCW